MTATTPARHATDTSPTPGPATPTHEPGLPDISTPTHVHDLVIAFYREIVFDEVLEPVFGEVAEVDWAEHIPKLIDYWCWILFGTGHPTGTVTTAHRHLHGLAPIRPVHCDRWYRLWSASVDARWSGPTATHAKAHAATLMAGMAKRIFGFEWSPPVSAA
jgi:hemoglobin